MGPGPPRDGTPWTGVGIRMDLDADDAFLVSPNFRRTVELWLEPTDVPDDFGELIYGLALPDEPVEFTVGSGTRPYDLVHSHFVGFRLASPRFISCLRAHGYGGWRTYPVRFTSSVPAAVSDHVGLQITGRTGPEDNSRSERVMLRVAPDAPLSRHRKGLYPTRDSWDGNDLFLLAGTAFFGITSAVRDALVGAGVRGPEYTRLSEVTMLDWEEDED